MTNTLPITLVKVGEGGLTSLNGVLSALLGELKGHRALVNDGRCTKDASADGGSAGV